MPGRQQVLMRVECDNELIPKAHQARVTWEVLGELDLSAFYQPIEARVVVQFRNLAHFDAPRHGDR